MAKGAKPHLPANEYACRSEPAFEPIIDNPLLGGFRFPSPSPITPHTKWRNVPGNSALPSTRHHNTQRQDGPRGLSFRGQRNGIYNGTRLPEDADVPLSLRVVSFHSRPTWGLREVGPWVFARLPLISSFNIHFSDFHARVAAHRKMAPCLWCRDDL